MANDSITEDNFLAISMYLVKIDINFIKPKAKKYFDDLIVGLNNALYDFGSLLDHESINNHFLGYQ